MAKALRYIIFFVVLSALYGVSYQSLRDNRIAAAAAETDVQPVSSLLLLPPGFLKVLAGEFKGMAADFMIFDIGARLGTEVRGRLGGKMRVIHRKQDWSLIHRLFVNCQSLDPRFAQTFVLAQGWLPWDANMLAETEKILQVAADHRPWDWQPLRYLGFNSYFFRNDPGRAGTLYLQAAQIPNSPPFLSILGGRLAQKGGATETAILLLKNMLEHTTIIGPDYEDIVDRLQALEGTLLIERAVKRYEELYNVFPETPGQLVSVGLLGELPLNPDKLPYCIDQAGKVYFDRPDCRNGGE